MNLKNYTNKEEIRKLFDLFEEELYQHSETNRKLVREIIEEEDKFCNTLTEEQKEMYDNINKLKLKNTSETDKNIFVYTYCLATRLILQGIC